MTVPSRLPAWREAFDLAVVVFRLTGQLDVPGTHPVAVRARRTAVQVPALVSRAAGRSTGSECLGDLKAALRCLVELEHVLQDCAPLVYTEPDEVRRIAQQIEAARREIVRMGMADRAQKPALGEKGRTRRLARSSLDSAGGAEPDS